MKAGMVGLGAMGAHMARHLHKAGYLAAVWNRTRAKADALGAELGVPVADSLGALAEICEVVITCVSRDVDVEEVVDALRPGLHAGSVIVDVSTISADTARSLAERLAEDDLDFVDAPVSGGVEGARNAQLVAMVGAEEEVLARVYPLLQCIAARIVHMGPVGAGQATKAVNQIMVAGVNQAVTEALAFGEAMGLPMDKVIEVVGSGAAGNWFLDHRGKTMVAGEYAPGFRVALHNKDLGICKQMAEHLGVQLPVVEMTLLHYRRLIEAGYGDEDISSLMREKRRLFQTKP